VTKTHKFIAAPEPTFGALILARLDAEEIAHDVGVATACGMPLTEAGRHVYADRVRTAQLRLGTLARRLGYEIVPARVKEATDA
jgi:hypothetical protein